MLIAATEEPRAQTAHLRRVVSLLSVLLAGCGSDEAGRTAVEPALDSLAAPGATAAVDGIGHPARYDAIDWAACLAAAAGTTPADESVCLGFVSEALAERIVTCRDVGGRLLPVEQATTLSLDVNDDGQLEFLFDATQSYYCDGAPSVFSCGSLGCPVQLVLNDGGRWRTIGLLGADDAVAPEVLPATPGRTFRTLRGGCAGGTPCDEWTYYDWTGESYAASMIEVRGQRVDIAPDGLWTLKETTAVLASPARNAAILERYEAGTVVVVIGTARDAPYTYVSPCNACESGFVAPTALVK